MIKNAAYERKRRLISQGSKTFRLASLFFSKQQRDEAYTLYVWCRSVDDQIDSPPLGSKLDHIWESLYKQTFQAIAKIPTGDPVFDEMGQLVNLRAIPHYYVDELLKGMKMDIDHFYYRNPEDLDLYCFRVAGVVGLMMCHIMGLSDPTKLAAASALGRAMQLTNICRDIKEDWNAGRCYLPEKDLKNQGIDSCRLGTAKERSHLFPIALSLLDRAERNYELAWLGLPALPLRAGLTIAVALELYREIGRKLRKKGPSGLAERVWVSTPQKLLVTIKTVLKFFWKSRWGKIIPRGQAYCFDLPLYRYEDIDYQKK